MKPMYLSIHPEKTGKRIKQLLKENGYTVKDVQGAMGFANPQAIYKWLSGRSLPSLDNLIILSRILNTSMEDILVIDGDVFLILRLTAHVSTNGSMTLSGKYRIYIVAVQRPHSECGTTAARRQ